jgi:hypothetical protein
MARRRTFCSRTRRSIRPSKESSRVYFNQGPFAAPGRDCSCRKNHSVIKKLRDRIQTLRVGNPLDKTRTSRDQFQRAVVKIRELAAAWTKARR